MGAAGESLAFLDIPAGSPWVANSAAITALENDFLPAYLAKARWFPGNSETRIKPKIIACLPFTAELNPFRRNRDQSSRALPLALTGGLVRGRGA